MKIKIKYPVNSNNEFINELRKKVSDYFTNNNISIYANSKMIIKAIFMVFLYTIPYLLMISGIITSFYSVLICWIIIGIGKAGVGMGMMHDANHNSFSRNRKINKWLGYSLFLLGGFPKNWQYQHNTLHHGFTNIEGFDEDIDPGPYLRISPHKKLVKIHKFQHIYAWFLYSLMTLSWVTTKDFYQLNRYRKEGVILNSTKSYGQLFFNLIIAKILYYSVFLILPIIIIPIQWYWIILFFIMMHLTSGLILTTIFQTAHVVPSSKFPLPSKDGNMDYNWAIHQLMTTSDFCPENKIISWFTGCLNFQIEHHLFPHICHIHYPQIAGLVKELAQKYKLPYSVQPKFTNAIWEHYKMLKNLGQ